jgi:hypothetical protein
MINSRISKALMVRKGLEKFVEMGQKRGSFQKCLHSSVQSESKWFKSIKIKRFHFNASEMFTMVWGNSMVCTSYLHQSWQKRDDNKTRRNVYMFND